MHERCETLHLPVVLGHGDLKPSNVMLNGAAVWFIDFELTVVPPSLPPATHALRLYYTAHLSRPPLARATGAKLSLLRSLQALPYRRHLVDL